MFQPLRYICTTKSTNDLLYYSDNNFARVEKSLGWSRGNFTASFEKKNRNVLESHRIVKLGQFQIEFWSIFYKTIHNLALGETGESAHVLEFCHL